MLSRCFLDFSVGVGAFVIGLSQIYSYFSCYCIGGNTSPGCNLVIDSASGAISPALNMNYESATTCELILLATDGGSPALVTTGTAVVTITGINEFTPTFAGPYTTNIPEDTTTGTSIILYS